MKAKAFLCYASKLSINVLSYSFKALTHKINDSSFKRKDKQAKFKIVVISKHGVLLIFRKKR